MSIQRRVHEYLEAHPAILDTLHAGLLNYSALVRQITKETKLGAENFDAILVAIRRYRDKTRKSRRESKDITKLLQETTIGVKNKQAVIILDKDAPLRNLTRIIEKVERERESVSLTQTTHALTLILHEQFTPLLEKQGLTPYIKKEQRGLVALTLHSPENLETVPGIIAHLTRLLANRGVNIVEITSCYTDTLIILEKEDLTLAMETLEF